MIIQLYIEGQRLELFKDESVTITDSIQNVRDIDKVFTAFMSMPKTSMDVNYTFIFWKYQIWLSW